MGKNGFLQKDARSMLFIAALLFFVFDLGFVLFADLAQDRMTGAILTLVSLGLTSIAVGISIAVKRRKVRD